MRCAAVMAFMASIAACAPSARPPPPPTFDSSPPDAFFAPRDAYRDDAWRPDIGPVDAFELDAGLDAADAPTLDAGPRQDSGPPRPSIDGVLSLDEWNEALREPGSPTPGSGPFANETLTALHALRTSETLYLAIEASLDPDAEHAVLLYLDADYRGSQGTQLYPGVFDLFAAGPIELALSQPLTTDPEVLVDWAWAATEMPAATSRTTGWRRLSFDGVAVALTGDGGPRSRSVCSAEVCETSVPLDVLGVLPGETLAIFVRLGGEADGLSGLTIPVDDPLAVGQLVLLPPGREGEGEGVWGREVRAHGLPHAESRRTNNP